MPPKKQSFKFKKNDQIGSAGAEEDEFLESCFVDTGNLELLEDLNDHRQIVLGRTGSGKSALLLTLARKKSNHVITISPEALALTYVANSTVLNFFTSIGVNLDPFFKLLWRHVLTVEILSQYFSKEESIKPNFLLDSLKKLFPGTSRKDREIQSAINYLEKWGRDFWQETEIRVKDITQQVEKQLGDEIKLQLGQDFASLGASQLKSYSLNEEQKTQLITRGQDIISRVQVKDLQQVLVLLDSVLSDRQKAYFIVIDGLDENWVEERLRYKLIMALILNAKEFNKVHNAKIIIALRRDLIERVFRLTRDSGFQEEKYHSLYLPLSWTKEQILDVLDKRINQLVTRKYKKEPVNHKDLLPSKFKKIEIGSYVYEMAPRPRDVISFFNLCIQMTADIGKIGSQELKIVEGEYSRARLRALGDEWSGDYPELLDFVDIFRQRPVSFKIGIITNPEVENFCLKVCSENLNGNGALYKNAMEVINCISDPISFLIYLMRVFFNVGLVGLKLKPHESVYQSGDLGRAVPAGEINTETSVVVNPPYRRALGVIEPKVK